VESPKSLGDSPEHKCVLNLYNAFVPDNRSALSHLVKTMQRKFHAAASTDIPELQASICNLRIAHIGVTLQSANASRLRLLDTGERKTANAIKPPKTFRG
jgi:hypothetical protein